LAFVTVPFLYVDWRRRDDNIGARGSDGKMKIGSTSLRTIGSVTPNLAYGIGNIQIDEVLLTTFF
jgi:hypothetical protein